MQQLLQKKQPPIKITKQLKDKNGKTIISITQEIPYYIAGRPVLFVHNRITNGTIYNETYIYLQDKLIAKVDNDKRKFFYHPDHLGSTTMITNESGDVVQYISYLPFGEVLVGTKDERFLYTGQEWDRESELLYYGARYYDPKFSKFLQPDPIIADIYNPQNLNAYSYVLNNPYKYVDPDGREVYAVNRGLQKRQYSNLIESIARGVGTHTYFDIYPDNPRDFGGEANIQFGAYEDKGVLISERGQNLEPTERENTRMLIQTPEGLTDTEFIKLLFSEGDKFNDPSNPVKYALFPGVDEKEGNSNLFLSPVAEKAGADVNYRKLSPWPRWLRAPGLGKVINFDDSKEDRAPRPSSGGAWGWNPEEGWWRVPGS
jgi:RHS repeat-associated protein